jgi:hypothetical protein
MDEELKKAIRAAVREGIEALFERFDGYLAIGGQTVKKGEVPPE